MHILNKKRLELLSSLFINVSAGYFIMASVLPGSTQINIQQKVLHFLYNIIIALSYFLLSVKIEEDFDL